MRAFLTVPWHMMATILHVVKSGTYSTAPYGHLDEQDDKFVWIVGLCY